MRLHGAEGAGSRHCRLFPLYLSCSPAASLISRVLQKNGLYAEKRASARIKSPPKGINGFADPEPSGFDGLRTGAWRVQACGRGRGGGPEAGAWGPGPWGRRCMPLRGKVRAAPLALAMPDFFIVLYRIPCSACRRALPCFAANLLRLDCQRTRSHPTGRGPSACVPAASAFGSV